MKYIVKNDGDKVKTGNILSIHNYLVSIGAEKRSTIGIASNIFLKLLLPEGKADLVTNARDELIEVTFDQARKSLYREIKESGREYFICIDDVDQLGFEYSEVEKMYIEALMHFMYKSNDRKNSKAKCLVVLSLAVEQYMFCKNIYGMDKVFDKTIGLYWGEHHGEKLGYIVFKRIAYYFGIRKKKREINDKYSIEKSQTWDRMFPKNFRFRDTSISSYEYLIRRSNYTPRIALSLLDNILKRAMEELYGKKIKINDIKDLYSEQEWASIFQDIVGEASKSKAENSISIYEHVFLNLSEIIEIFSMKSNIFRMDKLAKFLKDNNVHLDVDGVWSSDQNVEGLKVIQVLFEIGIIGIAVLKNRVADVYTQNQDYELIFSYTSKSPYKSGAEYVVVNPFYYSLFNSKEILDIDPLGDLIITPANRGKISEQMFNF